MISLSFIAPVRRQEIGVHRQNVEHHRKVLAAMQFHRKMAEVPERHR